MKVGALLALSMIVASACSPIQAVRNKAPAQTEDGGAPAAGDSKAVSGIGSTAQAEPRPKTVARIGSGCDADGQHGCSSEDAATLLACQAGVWTAMAICRGSERCVPSADDAKCSAVADECLGHEPDVPFCDGDAMLRVCSSAGTSTTLACGELERCQMLQNRGRCGCAPGTVDTGAGCEAATSCSMQNGGCDVLTTCGMVDGAPECGDCPYGYVGTGGQGCKAQLLSLTTSCGKLSPDFSPDVYKYQLQVPLLCQALQLTASGPSKASLTVDSVEVPFGAPWQSPLLAVGKGTLNVNLSTPSGALSSYKIEVERAGAQHSYVKASNVGMQDAFGTTVAVDGQTIAVGAPFEDSPSLSDPDGNSASDSGAVYVYVSKDGQWSLEAFLKPSSPRTREFFGTNVAISGDTMVVGAPAYNVTLFNTVAATGQGAAYVFVRSNGVWKEQAKLAPKAATVGDLFGFHVGFSGKDSVVIGAPYDDADGAHSGAVYAFHRNAGLWSEGQKIKAREPVASSTFGFSLSAENNLLIVGAPQDPTGEAAAGSAHIFERAGDTWTQLQRLQMAEPVARATFGWSVRISGDLALVSAPRMQVVNESTPPGEAYVFERNAGTGQWASTQTLTADYPHESDYFGTGLGINIKSATLAVGAYGDSSGARSAEGDRSRTDAPGSGSVVLYAKQSNHWVPTAYLKADNAASSAAFGETLALSDDTLCVGAPYEAGGTPGIHGKGEGDNSSAAYSGAMYIFH